MLVIGKREFGISGFSLRILGFITMMMGGLGFVKGYGYDWLEAFGWTSFTFYAFLLSEGIAHTTDRVLYFRRFFVFTILSEVAYDYMRFQRFYVWRYSSPMLTLFVGFVLLMIVTFLKDRFENMALDMLVLFGGGYLVYWFTNKFHFQFGGYGIMIIIMFYVARNVSYPKVTQIAVISYICFYLTSNYLFHVNIGGIQYPVTEELFSAIAIPFIWLYNDTRGPNYLFLQIVQYLSFVICMGVLILIRIGLLPMIV